MRCFAHVIKACKEVLIQHLLTERAVEAFDEVWTGQTSEDIREPLCA